MGKQSKQCQTLFFWVPKSLQMVTAAMKLKDAYSLEGKVMTNLDSVFKSRDIALPTKVCLVKAMVVPMVMYGCESWTVKKAECWRIDAFNCGVGEDSWESLGLQGDPTSPSERRSVLGVHWKDWCWSWNSNTLATLCEELMFWTVVLERTLESPLDCKEIKPVHPKGNLSWIFIGRTDAEAETSIFWPPDEKDWLIGKDPDAGKDWRQEEKGMTEVEMVG